MYNYFKTIILFPELAAMSPSTVTKTETLESNEAQTTETLNDSVEKTTEETETSQENGGGTYLSNNEKLMVEPFCGISFL